jgi:DNA-binding response OmpR family regulator
MPVIAVIEDDDGTRTLIASVLRKDGHAVLEAADGATGLAMVRERMPDLVVSDIQMPALDGFQMLAAMRNDAALTAIPVILLTSLQERAHMRIGMTTGADDYLTKPFRPLELKEAVNAQFDKRQRLAALQSLAVDQAVEAALAEQTLEIALLYDQRLARTGSESWLAEDEGGAAKFNSAAVLFVDIRDYATWAERLSSSELAQMVQYFYASAGDTVHLFGANHMQFVGEGLLAIFGAGQDTRSVNHGLRAVRAAFGLLEARKRVGQYAHLHFAARGLPEFDVVMALHAGPVTLTRLQGAMGSDAALTPVGDTVTSAMALQRSAVQVGWQIAATVQAARTVAGAVRLGRRALVSVPGRSRPLDAVELAALVVP